jgi:hypothetical protein
MQSDDEAQRPAWNGHADCSNLDRSLHYGAHVESGADRGSAPRLEIRRRRGPGCSACSMSSAPSGSGPAELTPISRRLPEERRTARPSASSVQIERRSKPGARRYPNSPPATSSRSRVGARRRRPSRRSSGPRRARAHAVRTRQALRSRGRWRGGLGGAPAISLTLARGRPGRCAADGRDAS